MEWRSGSAEKFSTQRRRGRGGNAELGLGKLRFGMRKAGKQEFPIECIDLRRFPVVGVNFGCL
jgi:hypothetical protein